MRLLFCVNNSQVTWAVERAIRYYRRCCSARFAKGAPVASVGRSVSPSKNGTPSTSDTTPIPTAAHYHQYKRTSHTSGYHRKENPKTHKNLCNFQHDLL